MDGRNTAVVEETKLDPFSPHPGPSVFVRSLFRSGTAFSLINFHERSVMFLPVLGKNYCTFCSESVAQFARRCAIIEERSEKYVVDNLFFQSLNIKPTAYAYGRTKIFFRNPRTVRYGNNIEYLFKVCLCLRWSQPLRKFSALWFPQLFDLEEKRLQGMHFLAVIIQKVFRGWRQRTKVSTV